MAISHRGLPDLSTRQLRAFVALAEQRNFTRAAQQMHLSQPAFSALIRALESLLETRLFERKFNELLAGIRARVPDMILCPAAAGRLWSGAGASARSPATAHRARQPGGAALTGRRLAARNPGRVQGPVDRGGAAAA